MNLVLIGFKASGKSTLGPHLAALLQKTYTDTDTLVEEINLKNTSESLSCRDIFTNMGERHFRGLEELALFRVQSRRNLVIGTGGGTVCVRNATSLLQATGHVIFLDTCETLLEKRLQSLKTPLFIDGNWRKLHAERYQMYLDAAHTVVKIESDTPPEDLAQELARQVAHCTRL